MYLVGAGVEDTGEYTCTIPGIGVKPALLTLYITQGRRTINTRSYSYSRVYISTVSSSGIFHSGVYISVVSSSGFFHYGVYISAVSSSVVCHGNMFGIFSNS